MVYHSLICPIEYLFDWRSDDKFRQKARCCCRYIWAVPVKTIFCYFVIFYAYIYSNIISTNKIALMLLDRKVFHSKILERIFGIFLYHKTGFFTHMLVCKVYKVRKVLEVYKVRKVWLDDFRLDDFRLFISLVCIEGIQRVFWALRWFCCLSL